MRLISFDHIKSAFKTQFDADVLLFIINVFTKQVLENPNFNNAAEQSFCGGFIECLAANTPQFDFTLDFMEEKDHAKIKHFISQLTQIDEDLRGKLMKAFE